MQWTITDKQRPWTANAERSMHYHKRAGLIKDARHRWMLLTMAEQVPQLNVISVEAQPLSKTRRWRPDVAACYPTVKSAIDGIVDAGVIADDDDKHLVSITFLPVQYGTIDGLRITIFDEES